MVIKSLIAIFLTVAVFCPVSLRAASLVPHQDLTYLGAFTTPDTPDFIRGPGGGTFYGKGDPANVDQDQYRGSIFIIASNAYRTLAEISIPQPEIRTDNRWDLLPQATALQAPTEVTEGYTYTVSGEDPNNPPVVTANTDWAISDVEILGAKQGVSPEQILFVLGREYTQGAEVFSIGSCDLNFSDGSINSKGYWKLAPIISYWSQYLFQLPSDWANAHADGNTIAIGQNRYSSMGSSGLTIFGIKPWANGLAPADGTILDSKELLSYPGAEPVMDNYIESNTPGDGTWIEIGDKNTVAFFGTYPERARSAHLRYGNVPQYKYQVHATPDEYGESKGFSGGPYQQALFLYDPETLKTDGTAQPYAFFSLEEYVFSGLNQSGRIYGMISYDETDNILYVEEKLVDAYGSGYRSVIHMFKVTNTGNSVPTTAPTAASNLAITSVDSSEIKLSWTPGASSEGLDVWHLVLRNGRAISYVEPGVSTYTDDKISQWLDLGTMVYKYEIMALDEYFHYSSRSNLIGYSFDSNNLNDVVYHHNCDFIEDASIAAGDAKVYPNQAAAANSNNGPSFGLGNWYNTPYNQTPGVGIGVPMDNNFSLTSGRLGFFVIPFITDGNIRPGVFLSTTGANPDQLSLRLVDNSTIEVGYRDVVKSIPVNYDDGMMMRLNYVEFEFGQSSCTVHWNGLERGIIYSSNPLAVNGEKLMFLQRGDEDANNAAVVDQITYSNDSSRNLWNIRSQTYFDGSIIANVCENTPSQCVSETNCKNAGWDWCSGTCQDGDCPVIRADVNQDSKINTTDATLLFRNSLGLDMADTDWQASATTGDVNCDGALNISDIVLLLKYSLGFNMSETDWCE